MLKDPFGEWGKMSGRYFEILQIECNKSEKESPIEAF